MKKFISCIMAVAMLAMSTVSFAAAPSEYDGVPYSNHGIESTDPDGEINLAVIANSDVHLYGDTMYIEGSIYSNGNIYVGDGQGNRVDGLFISGTEGSMDEDFVTGLTYECEGYIHVNSDGTRNNVYSYSVRPEYEGAIKDDNTSFECVYEDFEIPVIDNYIEEEEMNVFQNADWGQTGYPKTVTEDVHYGTLKMEGTQGNGYDAALTIDTTAGDVNVVIDNFVNPHGTDWAANPSIKVVGNNRANIYINNLTDVVNLAINSEFVTGEADGSTENTYVYLSGTDVSMGTTFINASNVYVNANSLEVYGNSDIKADIISNAETFTLRDGGTYITGTVCVPNADSQVINSGTLYGQLHTDTLTMNGAGSIRWKSDAAEASAEATDAPTATEAPTTTDAPAVTDAPVTGDIKLNIVEDVIYITPGQSAVFTVDHNTTYDFDWTDMTYTWEFGNGLVNAEGTQENVWWGEETFTSNSWTATPSNAGIGGEYVLKVVSREDPTVYDTVKIIVVDTLPTATPAPELPEGEEIDLNGLGYAYIFGYEPEIVYVDGEPAAEVRMAPDDVVTREQVAAMIMRMVDQKYNTTNVSYPSTSAIAKHDGTWYMRGLAYLAQNGAFDDVDSVEIGAVTRGEVAKLLAYGLNLSATAESSFTDIADNQYKAYIEIVASYGYMNGTGDGIFEPDRYMTRAEFCQMFNNVIGRTQMGLTAQDGSVVTQETYSIIDLAGHWAEEAMLKATSAYDESGLIDVETRIANIRNVLDNYDSQKWY